MDLLSVMNRLVNANLTPSQRAAIEQRILAASRSNEPMMRVVAVDGLKALDDAPAKARLLEIAQGDPFPGHALPPRASPYPVRDRAAKALASTPSPR
jgi:hypothetical protein